MSRLQVQPLAMPLPLFWTKPDSRGDIGPDEHGKRLPMVERKPRLPLRVRKSYRLHAIAKTKLGSEVREDLQNRIDFGGNWIGAGAISDEMDYRVTRGNIVVELFQRGAAGVHEIFLTADFNTRLSETGGQDVTIDAKLVGNAGNK